MNRKPNFLYIGSSKSGSTWIFKLLSWHPEIFMYPGKHLGFFTRTYDKGWDWYLDKFRAGPEHKAVGEASHSYLLSEQACQRIHQHLPDIKLIVCLREPVERTFSQYLDGIKNGKFMGSFEQELREKPTLIDHSRYGTNLSRYLKLFPREQIHIISFNDLVASPDKVAHELFNYLGVEDLEIPAKLHEKVLPAGQPRIRPLAMAAKRIARWTDQIGFPGLRGKIKTSPTARNILYRQFTPETRPKIPPEIEAKLRETMAPEVQLLDTVAGTDFCRLWGYPPPPVHTDTTPKAPAPQASAA